MVQVFHYNTWKCVVLSHKRKDGKPVQTNSEKNLKIQLDTLYSVSQHLRTFLRAGDSDCILKL